MTDHTPTPWKAMSWGTTISISNGDIDGIAFVNPHGDHDAGIPDKKDRENAAFIVRAVNAHDELVEALTLAYAALRDPNTRHLSHDGRGITETIKDALAKAEGRAQ